MAQGKIQLSQIDFGGRGPNYDVVVKCLSEHGFKWSGGGQTWNRPDGSSISDVALSDLCGGWPVFARELMAAVLRGPQWKQHRVGGLAHGSVLPG